MKYIICYSDGIPFLSIPINDEKIDIEKIKDNYYLKSDVVIKIEDKDVFIGW